MQNFFTTFLAAQGDTGALENNLNNFGLQLKGLFNVLWPWILGVGLLTIGLVATVLGIKYAKASKAEDRQEAKLRIKQMIIGISSIFIIALGLPMLISGIAAWAGIAITKF